MFRGKSLFQPHQRFRIRLGRSQLEAHLSHCDVRHESMLGRIIPYWKSIFLGQSLANQFHLQLETCLVQPVDKALAQTRRCEDAARQFQIVLENSQCTLHDEQRAHCAAVSQRRAHSCSTRLSASEYLQLYKPRWKMQRDVAN